MTFLDGDVPSKLDMEGLQGLATYDDDIRQASPTSPTSPLTKAVVKNSITQPGVSVVHRVRLRQFAEGERKEGEAEAPKRMTRRFSTGSCLPEGTGKEVKRASTLEPWSGLDQIEFAVAAQPEVVGRADRPSSAGAAMEPPKVRALSSNEVIKRNKDAVEWFRASRAINRNVRSIEDTSTLLEQARERRANGTDFVSRRTTSKELPLGSTKEEAVAAPVAGAAAAPKRRSLDAAALWGAKPIKKKDPAEEPKPPADKPSCMRGNVQVGATGENGLLARLRRRSTVH